jgi:hypothetical protein
VWKPQGPTRRVPGEESWIAGGWKKTVHARECVNTRMCDPCTAGLATQMQRGGRIVGVRQCDELRILEEKAVMLSEEILTRSSA